jgi:hypothetical protein
MGLKVYQGISKFNILFKKKDGTQVLVPFTGSERTFRTDDRELQGLVEGHRWFKEGQIAVVEEVTDSGEEEPKADLLIYEGVTDIQGAIDVLVTNFQVKETKLKTPDQVRKAAADNNVGFPNLKL